jgi:uncharacterized protein (TIGR02646 family)
MRTITRNLHPPACLAGQPPGQDWGTFMQTDCHRRVGESLRTEQHHVCCYCETPITAEDCHIEHMAPRSASPGHDYNYQNLAASCGGGKIEHCGRFKDDRHHNPACCYDAVLFCLPHDTPTCYLFRYLPNGDIVVAPDLDAADQKKAEYMIRYLGLCCPSLTGRRRKHARDLINTLGPKPDPETTTWAAEYYLHPNQDGKLQPFHSLSRTILGQ